MSIRDRVREAANDHVARHPYLTTPAAKGYRLGFREAAEWANFQRPTREQIARVLIEHRIECTGPGEVTCRGCRDAGWMTWQTYHNHIADAVLALMEGDR